MLKLTNSSRIFLATEAVDFRKGLDGMIAHCKFKLASDPMNGAMFAFINRDRSRIKIIFYDGTGYWICMKRLSEGVYQDWPRKGESLTNIDAKRFLILIMGPKGLQERVSGEWKKVI